MDGLWLILQFAATWFEHHAGAIMGAGLIIVSVFDWGRWRRDKSLNQENTASPLGVPDLSKLPCISILLPAWNEAPNIKLTAESILALRYPNIELVICAGGADQTLKAAQQYAASNVIVLEQYPGEGKQRAMGRCFEQASGEVIFLTDAGCVLDDDCFEKVIEPVVSGTDDVATGSWKPFENQLNNPFVVYQWTHSIYLEIVGGEYVASLIGRNAAVRRQALLQVGGFEATVPIGTDLFLSNQLLAAGYHIRFIRDSRIQVRYAETLKEYWRQLSRWLRNAILWGMRSETITIRGRLNNLRAGSAALFMLIAPIIGCAGSRTIWGLWSVMMWHLVLGQVQAVQLAEVRGVPRLKSHWQYMLFPLYMIASWIGMAYGLVESLFPWRRWRW